MRFAQAPWYLIREYAGIYGVKLDYSKIEKLSAIKINDAVKHSRTIDPFLQATSSRDYCRRPQGWKMFLLKRVSKGHKNRKFYDAIATSIEERDALLLRIEKYNSQ